MSMYLFLYFSHNEISERESFAVRYRSRFEFSRESAVAEPRSREREKEEATTSLEILRAAEQKDPIAVALFEKSLSHRARRALSRPGELKKIPPTLRFP